MFYPRSTWLEVVNGLTLGPIVATILNMKKLPFQLCKQTKHEGTLVELQKMFAYLQVS